MPPVTLTHMALVAAGSAVGGVLRFLLGRAAAGALGGGFPWGTLAVNLLGGLLMGVLMGLVARAGGAGEPVRLALGVGLLGGFTTFSAFSVELTGMLSSHQPGLALAYASSSVLGAVAALWAGSLLVRAL